MAIPTGADEALPAGSQGQTFDRPPGGIGPVQDPDAFPVLRRRFQVRCVVEIRRRDHHRIEIIHPSGNFEMALDRMESTDGAALTVAPGNGHRVWIPLAEGLQGAMLARFV